MADFMIGRQMAAHAGWVKVISENGVPGALLMIAFVLSFAVAGWRRRRWRVRVLGLMVTATMAIGFLTTEFQSKSLWFLGAGAMVLLTPDLQRRRRRRPGQGTVRIASDAPVVVGSR
jgi:O-antigen ligase